MTVRNGGTEPVRRPLWLWLLSGLVVVAALGNVILFLTLAVLRLSYPFDLEWVEGGQVDEIVRIAQGQSIFGPPSVHFVPFSYAPLFFYVSAGVTRLIGPGFAAPRLVSGLATVGCFVLLYALTARGSKAVVPGIVAAGLYAASYQFTGTWMDLAKTDSLFLLLILVAFWVGIRVPGRAGMLISGCLFVAAFYTKQMALPVVLVLAPISLLVTRGRTWLQWVSAGMLGMLVFTGADLATDGWFSFYSFDTLSYHERAGDFWLVWKLMLPRMWPAMIVGFMVVIWDLVAWRRTGKRPEADGLQVIGLCLALVLASWAVYQKVWTYANGLMPAAMGLALLTGLGLGRVWPSGAAQHRRACRAAVVVGLCLVVCQFSLLAYNPVEQLPSREDRLAGEALVARLSELPGEVLVYHRGYLATQAGKGTGLHGAAYGDVVGPNRPPRSDDYRRRKEMVRETLRSAITGQSFDWIISAEPEASWLPYYVYVERVFVEPDVFFPVTGARSRPESLMIRNPVARGGSLHMNDPAYDTLLPEGWRAPEHWGRWMDATHSTALIALEQGHGYSIEIGLEIACPARSGELVVGVGWNTIPLTSSSPGDCGLLSLSAELTSDQVAEGLNSLWFETQDGGPPDPAGAPAVGVSNVSFVQR